MKRSGAFTLDGQTHKISGFMHCSSAEDMDTLKNLRSVREKLGEDIRNKRGPDLSRIAV